VPGVIAESVSRVEVLPGSRVFAPAWSPGYLADTQQAIARPDHPARLIPVLLAPAAAVGCVGGIYGIGGGSILVSTAAQRRSWQDFLEVQHIELRSPRTFTGQLSPKNGKIMW
jgi:hypothetical protein